jgi:transposase
MLDYETYCRIVQLNHDNLRPSQIAQQLGVDQRTVMRHLSSGNYQQRKVSVRSSKLDDYKPRILQWIEKHPYSSVQIFQRLKQDGYSGGITIVKDYLARVRPRRVKAFLTLSFAPGECAQVDWGQYGTVKVGSTQRRLSFFVMVLCYSRMMYVEFTVSEKMEHFLGCHQRAFEFFGGVPEKVMVDNLKCAVIQRHIGQGPVFNQRYQDFANHHGYEIRACNVGKGNEKGRVENGVGYVKKNFLNGLDIPDFRTVNPTARQWLEQIANVRIHGTTREQPAVLFTKEKSSLGPLPAMPYDTGTICTVRPNNRFRITLDSNRYSVPAEYAGTLLTMKAYTDKICLYHENKLVAQHVRSYDRNQDFEHPDHPRALLAQRKKARQQRLLMRFLTISPKAEAYYEQLAQRRLNPRHHIRQIVALCEIYGDEKVARAIEDAFTYQAFSCEYIANILEQRQILNPQPGALHLTRRQDLLELDIAEPDLALYDTQQPHTGDDDSESEQCVCI